MRDVIESTKQREEVSDFEKLKIRAETERIVTEFADEKVEYSDGSPYTFKKKIAQGEPSQIEVLDSYDRFVEDRNHNLGNLNKIVARLLKKGLKSTGTQTDDAWRPHSASDSDAAVINDMQPVSRAAEHPSQLSASQLLSSQNVVQMENPIQDSTQKLASLQQTLLERIEF